jgi:L-iditol 2-dehydrogenase
VKAAYLSGIRQFEIKEKDQPIVENPHDVLIKITHVTVCGSDVHYYRTGRIGSQVVKYPFIVGHESSGVAEAVGDAVTRVKVGDRIAIDPAISCFECDQCRSGRAHTCRSLKFLGCPGQLEGSMVEYLVMPETSCFPVKPTTSLLDAALIEPLSVGVYAVKQSMIEPGNKIAIFGFGPIGMSVMLAGKANSANDYFVVDKIEDRLNIAKKEGAKYAFSFTVGNTSKQMNAIEKMGIDIVFECCGEQEAIDEAFKVLKPGGKLVIVGIPEFDYWKFPADEMRRKEISIINIRRQNECMQEAIDLVESGKVSLANMPTHHFDLSESQLAFSWVDKYRDGVMKAVLHLDSHQP